MRNVAASYTRARDAKLRKVSKEKTISNKPKKSLSHSEVKSVAKVLSPNCFFQIFNFSIKTRNLRLYQVFFIFYLI